MEFVLVLVGFMIFIAFVVFGLGQKARGEARRVIRLHVQALHLKRLQKRKVDDYGNIVDNQWIKEIDYFYDNVLTRHLGNTYDTSLMQTQKKKPRPHITYVRRTPMGWIHVV